MLRTDDLSPAVSPSPIRHHVRKRGPQCRLQKLSKSQKALIFGAKINF